MSCYDNSRSKGQLRGQIWDDLGPPPKDADIEHVISLD